MKAFFNVISVLSAFGFGIGCIYLLIDATLGRLKFLQFDADLYGIPLKDLFFLLYLLLSYFLMSPLLCHSMQYIVACDSKQR